MEKIQWKVDGMTCANCALTVNKYLQQQGARSVVVNPIDGDVSFELEAGSPPDKLARGIESLGYRVAAGEAGAEERRPFLSTHLQRFWFCLPFTAVLLLHMIPSLRHGWLGNAWVQLALTLPVFFVGMRFFGRSAVKSLRNGVPNMNVLISLGAAAAFVYSLAGALLNRGHDYLFFETAATIITLVFLGNYLEDASVRSTQRSLKALVRSQKLMANMIAFDGDHQEIVFPIESTQLKSGDLLLIKTGEQVPADCKILWGEGELNEAILTGESLPVHKKPKDTLIGGSILIEGTVKAQVTAAGADTVLSQILNMVKKAQGEKPPMQQLADRISAVFVPLVLALSLLTFGINWLVLHNFTDALLRAIAVLVIACPCAMGLATPAAIAVGLGRGARNGILFRQAKNLELFRDIRQAVFDKTGTLTTGSFTIAGFSAQGVSEEEFRNIVYSLEKYSAHPIAKSIVAAWKTPSPLRFQKLDEIKGLGLEATDREGNRYSIGSYAMASGATDDDTHNLYLLRNGSLLGYVDLADELRPEAAAVIAFLKRKGIRTLLLSGDRYPRTKALADRLGIEEVIAEQTPAQKLEQVERLSAEAPTVMIGDGVNDAPALAKATIGISLSEASQLAVQSAGVVLMNSGLQKLPAALSLGKATYQTIRQNLFWAFAYNIVAIPVAAAGLLSPTFAALVMGFSDVVLAANSLRLFLRRLD